MRGWRVQGQEKGGKKHLMIEMWQEPVEIIEILEIIFGILACLIYKRRPWNKELNIVMHKSKLKSQIILFEP